MPEAETLIRCWDFDSISTSRHPGELYLSNGIQVMYERSFEADNYRRYAVIVIQVDHDYFTGGGGCVVVLAECHVELDVDFGRVRIGHGLATSLRSFQERAGCLVVRLTRSAASDGKPSAAAAPDVPASMVYARSGGIQQRVIVTVKKRVVRVAEKTTTVAERSIHCRLLYGLLEACRSWCGDGDGVVIMLTAVALLTAIQSAAMFTPGLASGAETGEIT
jgi:hypothetical protein